MRTLGGVLIVVWLVVFGCSWLVGWLVGWLWLVVVVWLWCTYPGMCEASVAVV